MGTSSSVEIYETKRFVKTCVPLENELLETIYEKAFPEDLVSDVLSDIFDARLVEISAIGIAIVAGYIYLLIMRYFTGLMTWAMILSAFASLILSGFFV